MIVLFKWHLSFSHSYSNGYVSHQTDSVTGTVVTLEGYKKVS